MASPSVADRPAAAPDIAEQEIGEALDDLAQTLATLLARALACDSALAATIARGARRHDHAPHGVILDSAGGEQSVHLLAHGHARLIAGSIDGRMVVIEDYPPGELLGLTGLFGWDGVPAQVCAVIASRSHAFAGHAFVALMSAHAAIALGVSRMLVRRLSAANRRVAENATLSAPGRIHAELLRRARAGVGADGRGDSSRPAGAGANAGVGAGAGAGAAIRPMPVFSELALALQTTRESVSRAVSALEKRGIVRRDPDALVIVAPHRLEELVY